MVEEDDRRSGPDPEGFERRLAQYLEWMRVTHYSATTIRDRGWRLGHFIAWCGERELTRPSEVTRAVLERYQGALLDHRKKDGQPLSLTSQHIAIASLRGFFKWLARENLLLYNPAGEIPVPRLGRRLPKHILSAEDAERVLNETDVETSLGLRDRAILEVLYSTGLRRNELRMLALFDLDPKGGTLMVREGKGRHQRVVPIGERAVAWVEKYLAEVRPRFVRDPDEGVLFLTHRGDPFSEWTLTWVVHRYVERAGMGERGSVHLFRHTMATLMLENGADVRYVQEMLGHMHLKTTQVYTHVSIAKLKAVHAATHPARLPSPRDPAAEAPRSEGKA